MSDQPIFKCALCGNTDEITDSEIAADTHGWYIGSFDAICPDCLCPTFYDHEEAAKQAHISAVRDIMGIDSNGE